MDESDVVVVFLRLAMLTLDITTVFISQNGGSYYYLPRLFIGKQTRVVSGLETGIVTNKYSTLFCEPRKCDAMKAC